MSLSLISWDLTPSVFFVFNPCRVYQLALLEHEQRSTIGTPQGVILALVGAESPESGNEKDSKELHRTIRMYNLSSLASITRWATAHKVSSLI